MQQHGSKYFAHRPPPTLGMRSVGHNSTFQNMVMLHIKLKSIMKTATWLPADPPPPPPDPRDGVCWSKFMFFTEHGHVAYQIKEKYKCSNMVASFASRPQLPKDPRVWGQNVKI